MSFSLITKNMGFPWEAENYRALVNECLGHRKERRPRGSVKALAAKLRCHPTFIAQVLNGRANFSAEQGYEICRHFKFSAEQQDFFLTLLLRDRSGTAGLKDYYQKKLNYLLEAQRDLRPKKAAEKNEIGFFEGEYFGNWIYQAIHAHTQIQRFQSPLAIAKALKISSEEVRGILSRLEIMGLVKYEKSSWKSTLNSLHLSKDSCFIRNLHTTWKTKILSDVHNGNGIEGTRYSGLITVTEKDYRRVRDVLARAIGDIRKLVESSSAENVHVLSLDCYKM